MRIVKAVFSFSAALLAIAAGAQDYVDALERIEGARTPTERRRTLESLRPSLAGDETVAQAIDAYLENPTEEHLLRAREAIELRALAQAPEIEPAAAAERAKAVKESGPFGDPGLRETSNWYARLMQRLRNLARPDTPDLPDVAAPAGLGDWIINAVKVLLVLLAALFVFLAARHFTWRRKLKRQAAAMLDEDEPERTPDEWLERADALAAQGRHREAVRCLYLACLLRFDEHGVARFQRHETNWEHLRRIESSPRLPAGLRFQEPTRAFDRIWYGHHVEGQADTERFRTWYQETLDALKEKAA